VIARVRKLVRALRDWLEPPVASLGHHGPETMVLTIATPNRPWTPAHQKLWHLSVSEAHALFLKTTLGPTGLLLTLRKAYDPPRTLFLHGREVEAVHKAFKAWMSTRRLQPSNSR
jgi:hypothetical protein